MILDSEADIGAQVAIPAIPLSQQITTFEVAGCLIIEPAVDQAEPQAAPRQRKRKSKSLAELSR